MTAMGHVENGVVVFDVPVTLPEGAKVLVSLLDIDADLAPFPPDDPFHGLHPALRQLRGLLPSDFDLNKEREAALCDKLNIE